MKMTCHNHVLWQVYFRLEDASNEIYDFSTIDLEMMNENGELVEEDVKFILDGILEDVIRYKLKSAIESIQMVLE